MASSSPPPTAVPELASPSVGKGLARSVTMPTKIPGSVDDAVLHAKGPGAETLFSTVDATIIQFTVRSESGSGAFGTPAPGTLPWSTRTEHTKASGPLMICRVPGSVSFIFSGSILQPILPRSQLWCVDGVSKFALRLPSPGKYYRIELPATTNEDLERVDALKNTLAKIALYERTPCPFDRAFTVDLPEDQPRPRRSRTSDVGPAKRWRLQRANKWKREGEEDVDFREAEDSAGSFEQSDFDETATASDRDDEFGSEAGEELAELRDNVADLAVSTPTRPHRLTTSRSVTAPPHLTLNSTPPSRLRPESLTGFVKEASRPSAPVPNPLPPSRLQTFQPIPTDMPPSPPDSSAGNEWIESSAAVSPPAPLQIPEDVVAVVSDSHDACLPEQAPEEHRDDSVIADVTSETPEAKLYAVSPQAADVAPVTPKREKGEIAAQTAVTPWMSSPLRQNHGSPEIEDQFAQIQARILARRSIGGSTTAFQPRTQSLSSASTSATAISDKSSVSRVSNRGMIVRQQAFGTALVKKACSVFVGPPAYLVAIMLSIAKRFADGTLNVAKTFVLRQERLKMPGGFHAEASDPEDGQSEEDEDEALQSLGEWTEEDLDDFGVAIRSPIRMAMESAMAEQSELRSRRAREASPAD